MMVSELPCRRCGIPVEDPEPAAGHVPDGKGGQVTIDDLVLCVLCLELVITDKRKFWDEGWKQ